MATKDTVVVKPEYIYQYGWVIKNPRITEKSTKLAESNVYTFDIHLKANKVEIARAVTHIYGVKPVAVRVVNVSAVRTMKKNIQGRTKKLRKAYVYLKKGDSITLL